MPEQTTSPIRISDLHDNGDSVSAVVCIWPPELRVTRAQANAVLSAHPSLAQHACKQNGLGYFGDKLVGSTFAHLLEHLTIDILVEDARGLGQNSGPIYGNTVWLSHATGSQRVNIASTTQSADNVYTAIERAVAELNQLLDQQAGAQM